MDTRTLSSSRLEDSHLRPSSLPHSSLHSALSPRRPHIYNLPPRHPGAIPSPSRGPHIPKCLCPPSSIPGSPIPRAPHSAPKLTGFPLGPSSPVGPLGPGGPASPACPDSPFSPRSPRGPCRVRGGVLTSKTASATPQSLSDSGTVRVRPVGGVLAPPPFRKMAGGLLQPRDQARSRLPGCARDREGEATVGGHRGWRARPQSCHSP